MYKTKAPLREGPNENNGNGIVISLGLIESF